jgi:hypothetical protein
MANAGLENPRATRIMVREKKIADTAPAMTDSRDFWFTRMGSSSGLLLTRGK